MRKGLFLGFCILVVAGLATAVYWPQLSLIVAKPAPNTQVQNDKPEPAKPDTVAVVTPKQPPSDKPPVKPADPPPVSKPSKPPDPVKPPVKPPETSKPPVKPPVKPPDPVKPPVKPPEPPPQSVVFPRRALAVSVNNYLYANPISFGPAARGARNPQTLLERLNSGLRLPMDQMALLSDAAGGNAARPPVKPVIEKAVSDFLTTSREQDRVVVLFVGHAVEIEEEPYLVPLEGDLEDKQTLIPLKWFYERLAGCRARQKVLILDVCRTNPSRGQERPGGGPMGAKLDALLKTPPAGVQVWSSCVAQQHSYESESGVFLDALTDVVTQGLSGSIQKPDEPIPVARLAELVNLRMKDTLDKDQRVQTSRVSGEEPPAGAPYDSSQPRPPTVAIEIPQPEGGAANLEVVRGILKDLQLPAIKSARDDPSLRAEAMPTFAAKALEAYKDDGTKTPFRDTVVRGRETLSRLVSGKRLREEFRAPANETRFKDELKDYQMREVAGLIGDLTELVEDLKTAGKDRDKETSKRWQANYDYVLARLQMQLAYLYEYTTLLGAMRKDLPMRDPKIHGGWRLAPQAALTGDAAGKKLEKEAKKALDKLAKENPNTPWEVLAKRERYTALGLDWMAVK